MPAFLAADWPHGPFPLFSAQHLAAIGTVLAVIALSCGILRRREAWRRPFRLAVASLLVLQELSYEAWHVAIGDFHPGEHLPFHLCGMAIVLSVAAMLTRRPVLFEILYFWGLGGATQAILTPDLGPYSFPHYRFFQIFLSHGLIWLTVAYLALVEGQRLGRGAYPRVVGITLGWMGLAALVNVATDGNYGFLCRKPPTASLLDVLGPWPWYVLAMQGLGIAVFGLLALPWWIAARLARRPAPG